MSTFLFWDPSKIYTTYTSSGWINTIPTHALFNIAIEEKKNKHVLNQYIEQ